MATNFGRHESLRDRINKEKGLDAEGGMLESGGASSGVSMRPRPKSAAGPWSVALFLYMVSSSSH